LETRKLIKFGNSSHVISIPGTWLKKNNLNKGDLIYFEQNGDNGLVISPEKKESIKEEKEITILTEKKDISILTREIVSAYLENYRILKLKGNNIQGLARELKPRIQNLIGLEVIDQDTGILVAKDLLDLDAVSLSDVLKRMDIIARAMLTDIGAAGKRINPDDLNQRDENVNRLYFLALRTIRKALDDTNLRTRLGMSNGDLLRIWHLIHHIETIADEAKYLSALIKKTTSSAKELDCFIDTLAEIEKLYIETMKSVYKKEQETAYILSQRKDGLIKKIEKLCRASAGNLSAPYERLKNIVREIHKLGRRVYS